MKIGELATATGTTPATIRFYEAEALLPAPERTASNYREYADEHVERLHFIRRCRSLDMELEEIRALLRFKDAPDGDCAGVNRLLDEHLVHVGRRVQELKALQGQLKALRAQCRQVGGNAAHCGILQELSAGSEASQATAPQHVRGVHR